MRYYRFQQIVSLKGLTKRSAGMSQAMEPLLLRRMIRNMEILP